MIPLVTETVVAAKLEKSVSETSPAPPLSVDKFAEHLRRTPVEKTRRPASSPAETNRNKSASSQRPADGPSKDRSASGASSEAATKSSASNKASAKPADAEEASDTEAPTSEEQNSDQAVAVIVPPAPTASPVEAAVEDETTLEADFLQESQDDSAKDGHDAELMAQLAGAEGDASEEKDGAAQSASDLAPANAEEPLLFEMKSIAGQKPQESEAAAESAVLTTEAPSPAASEEVVQTPAPSPRREGRPTRLEPVSSKKSFAETLAEQLAPRSREKTEETLGPEALFKEQEEALKAAEEAALAAKEAMSEPSTARHEAPAVLSPADAAQTAATTAPSHLRRHFETHAPGGAPAQGGAPLSDAQQARLLQRVSRAFRAAEEGGGEVRIRLSPPELGSMKLELSLQSGVLQAKLEVETQQAQAVLLDNLAALRERLAEQGIRVEKFDVNLQQREGGGQQPQQQSPESRQSPRWTPDRARSGEEKPPTESRAAPRTLADPARLNIIV